MAANGGEQITKVLFCGPHFPASHNYTREYLQDYPSIQVDDVPLDEVPEVIANYQLCVVKMMKMNSHVISRAKQMKLIMQFGVGLEGVDIDAATKSGIKVARIPGDVCGNAASCAEMAIYLMLGLLRKQNDMQRAIKQRKLGDPNGETLLGKTVFILGFGNIGIDLAKRLRPFGVKIIATKRSWTSNLKDSCRGSGQNDVHGDLVDEKGSHEDIYKFSSKADIVVCCLTQNTETVGIVNRSFISSMRKAPIQSAGVLKNNLQLLKLPRRLWITNLLGELGVSLSTSLFVYCDNIGITYLCSNPVFHSRMKLIAIDFHFVRDQVAKKQIRVSHVHTTDQLADCLTKALAQKQFQSYHLKFSFLPGSCICRGIIEHDFRRLIKH